MLPNLTEIKTINDTIGASNATKISNNTDVQFNNITTVTNIKTTGGTCYGSSCQSYITYNGTHLRIKVT